MATKDCEEFSQFSYNRTSYQNTFTEKKLLKERQQDAGKEMQPSEKNKDEEKKLTSACLIMLLCTALYS